MPPTANNRSGEMQTLVEIVQRGSFAAAARSLELTPSAVSKLLSRLEARLGARLLQRSTRKLQLTPEGNAFYQRSLRVLADIDEAERCVSANLVPRGRVSIHTSVSLGQRLLAPLVPRFLAQQPQVQLDLVLSDRVVDLIDERADIAIRFGALPASDLVARRLGQVSLVIVGAPSYLARCGTPQTLAELQTHNRLGWTFRRHASDWPLRINGQLVNLPVAGTVRASDGETLMQLALAGTGLARLSRDHAQSEIEAGRLVPVMEASNPNDTEPLHAVYLGQASRLPARVRVTLDFLAQQLTQAVLDAGRVVDLA